MDNLFRVIARFVAELTSLSGCNSLIGQAQTLEQKFYREPFFTITVDVAWRRTSFPVGAGSGNTANINHGTSATGFGHGGSGAGYYGGNGGAGAIGGGGGDAAGYSATQLGGAGGTGAVVIKLN